VETVRMEARWWLCAGLGLGLNEKLEVEW